ncbi:MAG TPA: DUF3488 domain-containing protein, partial [Jatrophihabitans sp.]|nr:DUF3488 domain-containing protein [Jatrophihabitans sp.]
MTATQQRPASAAGQAAPANRGGGKSPARPAGQARSARALVAVTLTVAGGMLLTTLPLQSIFTDGGWLFTSVLCGLPYLALVAGLRRHSGTTRWWHSVVGLAGSVLMLLWVFVPQHLYYGVLPTTATGRDIGDLVDQARQIMQSEHAPLHSSPPLRLLVAAALVGLLCLTDVLGVLLRQPLLAAAPLLEVLAVASATSARSANPVWFTAAAVGFLLILLAGTRLQDLAWGPSVDGSAGRLGGGRRMAVTGIVAALIVPLLLPAVPTNLLARATHHGGNGAGPGGGQVVLNTLASLRGSLKLLTPVTLFTVKVPPGQHPFYIRQAVDEQFTDKGWQQYGNPAGFSLDIGTYPTDPPDNANSDIPTQQFEATFTIFRLGGKELPILANPTDLRPGGGNWDRQSSTASGVELQRRMSYGEAVRQLNPTLAQLRAAPAWDPGGNQQLNARYLAMPKQPAEVQQLAQQLTADQTTAYDKAHAISDYFTNGKNGFSYSLDGPQGDGSNALV